MSNEDGVGGAADGAPSSADGRGGEAPRLSWRLLVRPVSIFVASRLAVLVTMWLGIRLVPEAPPEHIFLAWDASLYLQVIQDLYPANPPDPGVYAFFPLFPLLSRAVSSGLRIGAAEAGLLVSGVAGVGAAVNIWLLCHRLLGRDAADRAVALFCFFPGSFVLSMLYAEGVMLALSAACLWALISRRWLLGGIFGALATASRPNAVAVIAACAWASGAAIVSRREWRSLVAPALAPVGITAFFGLLWARTGDPAIWFTTQRDLWHEKLSPLALVDDFGAFSAAPFENTNTTVVVLGALVCFAGLLLLVRSSLPPVLTVYSAVVIALAACSVTLGPRPRFVLTAFPIFFVFGLQVRGLAFNLLLAASATALGAFTLMSLSTLLFTP